MAGFDLKDHTDEYDTEDVEKVRFLSVLSYMWIFVLIPVFAARDSEFMRFHRRQGILLLIIQTVYALVIFTVLTVIRGTVGSTGVFAAGIILYIGLLLFAALSVFGIVNAVRGKAIELPFIGALAERFKST